MSESKHTPGPWRVAHKEGTRRGMPVVAWGDLRVYGKRSAALKYLEADARLIASAPELLEAAKLEEKATKHWELCGYCDTEGAYQGGCGVYRNMRRDAEIKRRAAIAKAEGK